MKRKLLSLLISILVAQNIFAAIVDCGCAYQGTSTYDVEISYQGEGDCCHPVGFGTWSHLDAATNELLSSGHLNAGDAAGACQGAVGSLGC